jgi:hypothetical protein
MVHALMALLHHLALGQASPHAAYLASIPRECPGVLMWSEAEVQMMNETSNYGEVVAFRERTFTLITGLLKKAAASRPELFPAHPYLDE